MDPIELPYYPKGYGVRQALKNGLLIEFRDREPEYLIEEYGSVSNFIQRLRDIRDFFEITEAKALEYLNERIEEEELFDDYYDERYGVSRQKAIDDGLQTQEDRNYEQKTMMKNDEDTIFDFTIGVDKEGMKEFINQLARFHFLILEMAFRKRKLKITPMNRLRSFVFPHFEIEEAEKKLLEEEERAVAQKMGQLLQSRQEKGEDIGILQPLTSDAMEKILEKI